MRRFRWIAAASITSLVCSATSPGLAQGPFGGNVFDRSGNPVQSQSGRAQTGQLNAVRAPGSANAVTGDQRSPFIRPETNRSAGPVMSSTFDPNAPADPAAFTSPSGSIVLSNTSVSQQATQPTVSASGTRSAPQDCYESAVAEAEERLKKRLSQIDEIRDRGIREQETALLRQADELEAAVMEAYRQRVRALQEVAAARSFQPDKPLECRDCRPGQAPLAATAEPLQPTPAGAFRTPGASDPHGPASRDAFESVAHQPASASGVSAAAFRSLDGAAEPANRAIQMTSFEQPAAAGGVPGSAVRTSTQTFGPPIPTDPAGPVPVATDLFSASQEIAAQRHEPQAQSAISSRPSTSEAASSQWGSAPTTGFGVWTEGNPGSIRSGASSSVWQSQENVGADSFRPAGAPAANPFENVPSGEFRSQQSR